MQGILRKMAVSPGEPVEYSLRVGDESASINSIVEKTLSLSFTGQIVCIACGRNTRKSFAQGYCYPCFQDSPECAPCIIRPELCQAHEGIGRDMEWERKHHLQEHIVYLTHTGTVKVGVTRSTNVPARWIDQGATMAMVIARTPNRYEAGLLEVAFKEHITDRTNWRKMLQGDSATEEALISEKERLLPVVAHLPHVLPEAELIRIAYPVNSYPAKVKSLGFDKQPEISGTLVGIKGQYLMFEGDEVLNVRKHQGYCVDVVF
jgi:hypothetical protein